MKHAELLGAVGLVVFDVDGVLTDGSFLMDGDGREYKRFNTQDGYGIRALQHHGVEVAIITGRRSGAVTFRMEELDVAHVFQGCKDKLPVLRELSARLGVGLAQTAYVGDDLPDLEAMRAVGVPIAVANAVPDVRDAAVLVTRAAGGNGAAREVCDLLIEARAGA